MVFWFFINLRTMEGISYRKEFFKSFFLSASSLLLVLPWKFIEIFLMNFFVDYLVWSDLVFYYIWSTTAMSILIWYQKKKGIR